MDMIQIFTIQWWWLILCLFIVLIFLCGFIYFIYFCASRILCTGGDKELRLIVAVLSALTFRDTLRTLILHPISSCIRAIGAIANELAFGPSGSRNLPVGINGNDKVESYLNIFEIESFPFSDTIKMMSAGVILYFVLKYVSMSVIRSVKLVNRDPKPNFILYNSFIVGVLFLSLYLVVSVFIAIPYLDQISRPSNFNFGRLDTELSNISRRDSIPIQLTEQMSKFVNIRGEILTTEYETKLGGIPTSMKSNIVKYIESAQQSLNNKINERQSALNPIFILQQTYRQKVNNYKGELLRNFEKESQSILIDKGELFENSARYLLIYIEYIENTLRRSVMQIKSTDAENVRRVEMFVKSVQAEIDNSLTSVSQQNPAVITSIPSLILLDYDDLTSIESGQIGVPSNGNSRNDWGFLGNIASYLITTQSSELVILMGMFGFGLFGASMFSFRKLNAEEPVQSYFISKPIVDDFGYVLARGFGAALVIYLATKGGLTLFSANGAASDPNGYVLLLTCFFGAIFSDKIWDRAKTYFDTSSSGASSGAAVIPTTGGTSAAVPGPEASEVPDSSVNFIRLGAD